jgi:hypothetical protein
MSLSPDSAPRWTLDSKALCGAEERMPLSATSEPVRSRTSSGRAAQLEADDVVDLQRPAEVSGLHAVLALDVEFL